MTVLLLSAVTRPSPLERIPLVPTPGGPCAPSSLGETFCFFSLHWNYWSPKSFFSHHAPCLLPLVSPQLLQFLPIKNEEVQPISVLKLGKLSVPLRDFNALPEDVFCTHAELPWHVHKLHSFLRAAGLCLSAPKTSYYPIILDWVHCHQIPYILQHELRRFRQIRPRLHTNR